ncbi:MAG: response regulator transcription factor [Anaerolineales bacterium]|nr:response regulator transcription factor [Anaerolineales bacterium]
MKKASHKILIIDDEPDVTRAVTLTITVQEPQWQVISAHQGETGLELVDTETPDLVLLDLSMPGMHGFEVLEQIRLFSDVPVIILTVQDDELDKVRGLELGADDYIVKPFGHLELLARIRSVLRRVEGSPGPVERPFVNGDLRLDFNRRRVMVGEKEIRLTSTEFRLLEVLARQAGRVMSSEVLLSRVWGRDAGDDVDYLKAFIYRLRQKIEPNPTQPRYLHTERGVGYWLDDSQAQAS